ncbi:MAG TPA: AMIN domain-containing protein [Terriglobales bacterium]|nr:AMIN domain-containing protein [Terriglobales bacterium]
MKKLTTGILAVAFMAGGFAAPKAAAQNPDAIDNARSIAKSLQQKQANDTNAALGAAGVPSPAKPAPGAPAPAVKPAAIPGASQASSPVAPSVSAHVSQAAKPEAVAKRVSAHNQLEKVNVVKGADSIQIEISSREAVTPRVSQLSSPARILVELPETVVASPHNKIAVGEGGVKGVRIGMDGKNPPTTSVVVDLEKPLTYELTPGAAGEEVLTLHTQGGTEASAQFPAKSTEKSTAKIPAPAPTKIASAPMKSAAHVAMATAVPAKPAVAAPKVATVREPFSKNKAIAQAPKPESKTAVADAALAGLGLPAKAEDKKSDDKKWAMTGKRDPFFSPVVQQSGSGCSTGKKCLEINAINVRGVVKSDNGFIAVVTNALNKAYFLRENDPVFNGYVVKITGDSVVFQETVQDKLGKSFTREVVKRIFTPAV